MHDVVIIGGGISAHTAALYTSRASLNPVVLSGPELDQLSMTTDVENFPGWPDGIMGPELVQKTKKQAEKFGATYEMGFVDGIDKKDDGTFVVKVKDKEYPTRTIIIATGASARMLGIPGESDFFGKGVSSCAVCDAAFYKDKEVVVIGGGDSAMEEALALYKFASKVTVIHRRDEFRASKIMQDRVLKLTDKITVLWDTKPIEVLGDTSGVIGTKVENVKTGEVSEVKCDGFFLAIGHIPNTKPFDGLVQLDDHGYVVTQQAKTNVPGVFAGGDCQDTRYKQAVTSAGSSCMAALEAEWYIEDLKATGKY